MSPIERIKSIPNELPPSRLYLEDIDEIVRLLLEASRKGSAGSVLGGKAPDHTVKFYLKGYVCTSLEEARRIARRTRELAIEVGHAYTTVSLYIDATRTTWLAYSLPYEARWELYARLLEIFEKRKVGWKSLLRDSPNIAFAVMAATLPLLLVMAAVALYAPLIEYKNVLFAVGFIGVLALLHQTLFRHTTVELVSVHEKPDIMESVKKWLPYAIGAAIGSAVTFFVTRFLQKLWP